jgi:uncharacterized repeat protein (TIGR03803 family)
MSVSFRLSRVCVILLAGAALCVSAVAATAPTEKVLHEFSDQQRGAGPAGLVSDSTGNLFGATQYGGQYNLGAIFEFSPKAGGGWTEKVVHSFAGGSDGVDPYQPVLDSAGNVYGELGSFGYDGCNCIYKLAHNQNGSWTKTVIHTFQPTDGSTNGLLIIDDAGNLYGGLTYYNNGSFASVFKLTPSGDSWTETTLYTFSAGAVSYANIVGLAVDGSGNVFGSLSETATALQGLLFELTPSAGGWTEVTLYTFLGGSSGGVPAGPLLLANGNLFGTTSEGGDTKCNGQEGCGLVYELVRGAGGQWVETAIYTFRGNLVGQPTSPWLGGFDTSGNLYGSALIGGSSGCPQCGSVFQLTPAGSGTWKQTTLWAFVYNPQQPIYYPEAVTVTAAGQVFGILGTPSGYYYQQGSIFELTAKSSPGGVWGFHLIYIFPFTDGQWPSPGLVADAAGNLYGTTQYGGSSNLGMVFELSPTAAGWKESTLYNFPSAGPGVYASGGPSPLTFDSKGNLFGTTEFGGASDFGTVFELSPMVGGGWQEQDLYSFSASSESMSGLVFDSSGRLYGVTFLGGAYGFGSVFQMTQQANGKWQKTTLYSFQGNPNDGANPYGGLIIDSAGNLYGTTEGGGNGDCFKGTDQVGCGTVFELSNVGGKGWTETILYQFFGGDGGDGSSPVGGLIFDSSGNLYGTTSTGGTSLKECPSYGYGAGCGTVFELSPSASGWNETILYEFLGGTSDGSDPIGLVWDRLGNLYGPLDNDAAYDDGAIFKLTPSAEGWTESIVHNFGSGSDGRFPQGALVFGASGNLYGTTVGGGVAGGALNNGQGTVFAFTP